MKFLCVLSQYLHRPSDLVTKASIEANARAIELSEKSQDVRTTKEYVLKIEKKMSAMEEWALASAEAKRIAMNRCIELEEKITQMTLPSVSTDLASSNQFVLWEKSSSLVVGAGNEATYSFQVGKTFPKEQSMDNLVLKFQVDVRPVDSDIVLSIFKGPHTGTCIISKRKIHGGGMGEAEGCLDDNGMCTLFFSNKQSWIRPRTVKFQLQVVKCHN